MGAQKPLTGTAGRAPGGSAVTALSGVRPPPSPHSGCLCPAQGRQLRPGGCPSTGPWGPGLESPTCFCSQAVRVCLPSCPREALVSPSPRMEVLPGARQSFCTGIEDPFLRNFPLCLHSSQPRGPLTADLHQPPTSGRLLPTSREPLACQGPRIRPFRVHPGCSSPAPSSELPAGGRVLKGTLTYPAPTPRRQKRGVRPGPALPARSGRYRAGK